MAEVAALNLAVNSDSVKQATVELKAMVPAASAAERAAQKWGMSTTAAARSSEDFSKRVQRTIKDLEFERQQLTRNAAEQQKYAVLKRAGVTASSAEGQAISAAVAALQAQKAAMEGTSVAAKAKTAAMAGLTRTIVPLIAAYVSLAAAQKLWQTAMSAGDLGEQAEQVGINTDQLQAYRLAAAQAGIQTEQMDTAITKLARSMGDAASGNKEAIERFEQLGVKLLDARGELRPVADVLPEVAKGVLNIGSSSQRTATLMDLFGKSGAKMATVLEEVAKGNDYLIDSASRENAIISPAAIAAWDALGDRLTVTKQKWSALVGEFGAPIALSGLEALNAVLEATKKEIEGIAALWRWLVGNVNSSQRDAMRSSISGPAEADRKNLQDRLDALRQNPTQFGFKASEKALMDQLASFEDAAKRATTIANQAIYEFDESLSRADKLPASVPPLGVAGPAGGTAGAGSPKVTGGSAASRGGGSAGRDKAIDEAAKAAEKLASWMRDANVSADTFLANQEVERQSLFMTAEAAEALRIETDFLNKAKADDVILTDQQKASLAGYAAEMAASAERTRQMTEMMEFGRETFRGFLTDFRQGLVEGQSVWEAFGNAGLNALNKIADKLFEMAANQLFEKAFSGGGGSGGILGMILGAVGSAAGGAAGGGAGGMSGSGWAFANGAAFRAGNVIPFASGGLVNSPTMFPMSGGRSGLMGEAGPEAIMPLKRGPGGRLGVEASNTNNQRPIIVEVHANEDFVTAKSKEAAVQVVQSAAPQIEARAVKKSNEQAPAAVARYDQQRRGDWRNARG